MQNSGLTVRLSLLPDRTTDLSVPARSSSRGGDGAHRVVGVRGEARRVPPRSRLAPSTHEREVEVLAPRAPFALGRLPAPVDPGVADFGNEALVEVGILPGLPPGVTGAHNYRLWERSDLSVHQASYPK